MIIKEMGLCLHIVLRQIVKYSQLLPGKRETLVGLLLGILSAPCWSAVPIVGNAAYVVKQTEEAAVFRGNLISEIVGPGIHFSIPGVERVVIYDLVEVHSGSTGIQKYILFDGKYFEMNTDFDWRICASREYAEHFQGLDTESTGQAMGMVIGNTIRVVLFELKVIDFREIGTEKFYDALRVKAEEKTQVYGVCLVNSHRGSNKAIRFNSGN